MLAVFMLINTRYISGQMNFKFAEIFGYVTMIVSLSTVFLGIRSYRENMLGGKITLRKAIELGLLITLLASVVYVLSWMIYSSTGTGKEMMEQYYAYAIDTVKAGGGSEEEIQSAIESIERSRRTYSNPLVKIGMSFMEIFPVGLVITLLSAFVLRTPSSSPLKGGENAH